MQIEIYAAYGVLAHEKRPVYSELVPASEAYDRLVVEIPDSVYAGETWAGEHLVNLGGMTYLLSEVMRSWGDHPALVWSENGIPKHLVVKEVCG